MNVKEKKNNVGWKNRVAWIVVKVIYHVDVHLDGIHILTTTTGMNANMIHGNPYVIKIKPRCQKPFKHPQPCKHPNGSKDPPRLLVVYAWKIGTNVG